MFQVQEPPAGSKDPMTFREGFRNVRDAAQRERADDCIERLIVKGEILAIRPVDLEPDRRLLQSTPGSPVHPLIRLNEHQVLHLRRIMGQVQACSESDFQDPTNRGLKQLLA
jgi:hypothetical protein